MLLTRWLRSLRAWMSGTAGGAGKSASDGGGQARRRRGARPAESLEDRTLLSVTAMFFEGDLAIGATVGDPIVVSLSNGQVKINGAHPATGPLPAVNVRSILVYGSSADNFIDLSAVQPFQFPNLTTVFIDAGQGRDSIIGSGLGDSILGGHGDDTVLGGFGADTISGGDGNDVIDGGEQADLLFGRDGNDTIAAGLGDDTVDAGDGQDSVDAGDGADSVSGNDGRDTLIGGAGADTINGGFGEDSILTGADDDVVFGGADADTIFGGDGNDRLNGQGGDDVILGEDGDDSLVGGTHNDFMFGGAGNDNIRGDGTDTPLWDGDDTISGGAGNDTIDGDGGQDSLLGGIGNDLILGSQGHDFALGGAGNDVINGQSGNDSLFGGGGADTIDGGSGQDLIASAFPAPDPGAITISINDVIVNPEGDPTTGITFPPALSFTVGGQPNDLVTGDFNGDGAPDVAVTDFAGNRVVLLLGDGDGNFGSTASLPAGTGTYGLAAGDFDGDGDLDLAVTNRTANTISLFRNNGLGVFAAAGVRAVGNGPQGIAFADINGDGDLDLLVANSISGTVSVLSNSGNGTFTLTGTLTAAGGAAAVAVADFDGDGDFDLAVANATVSTVSVFRNNGNGTYGPATGLSVASGPQGLVAADLNGDGAVDLATANSNAGTVSILIGAGNGTFAPAFSVPAGTQPRGLAAADIDSDGDLDLVVTDLAADTVLVLVNNGSGAFPQQLAFGVGDGPIALGVAPLDADGDADIVTANANSGDLSVLLNGSAMAAFVVTLSAPSSKLVAVDVWTQDGTAIAGLDYEERFETLLFAPGETQKRFFVPIVGDEEIEFPENFFANLSDAINAAIGDGQGEAVIIDDDFANISINDVSVFEGNVGLTPMFFTVSLDVPSVLPITVDVATQDGTARAGSDYLPLAGTLTFPPGVTTQTFSVSVVGNLFAEGDEFFTINLSNPTGPAAIADAVGVGTILEDGDTLVGLEILDSSVVEGTGPGTVNMTFVIRLTAPLAVPVDVMVNFATADGTAVVGTDYVATTGTATIPAGLLQTTVAIPVFRDTLPEGDEFLFVNLVPGSVTLGPPPMGMMAPPVPGLADPQAIGTIIDDETSLLAGGSLRTATRSSAVLPAAIGVAPETNPANLVAALTAGGGAGLTVTGAVLLGHTLPSGAASSGIYTVQTIPDTYGLFRNGIVLSTGNVTDYVTGPNTSPGFTTAYGPFGLGVPATPAQEMLLDPITGGGFSHFDATQLTIQFDMQPGFDTIFFDVVFGSEEFPEFVGSPFIDGFGLYVNGINIASVAGAPVNINHPNMAAIPGTELDGVLAPGGMPRLQFSAFVGAGSTGNTLTIIIADTEDGILDSTVYISSLSGSIVEASIADVMQLEGDVGFTEFVFTVELAQPTTETVLIDYATADGTAVAGEDYLAASGTLTFLPGQTVQTITILVIGDTEIEPDETFFVNLTGSVFANLVDTQAIGVILDDDTPVDPIGDVLLGGTGDDTILGAEGNDFINGQEGDDNLDGGEGNDTIFGGAGRDSMHGGEGNDLLRGGGGTDSVFGDAGNDTLVWETGNGTETVDGGSGLDQFRIQTGSENDRFVIDDQEGHVRIVHRIPSVPPEVSTLIARTIEDVAIVSGLGHDRVEVLDLTRAAALQMLIIDVGGGQDFVDAGAQLDPTVRM